MIGRHSDLSVYKEIFKSSDFIRIALGGIFILVGVGISEISAFNSINIFGLNKTIIASILFITSVGINGIPIIIEAVGGIIKRKVNVDELVSIAIIACLINGNYLEASIVSFIMVFGALIEEAVSNSARKNIQGLIEISPDTAIVEVEGSEVEKPISELRIDDIVLVRAGDTIPVDGIITEGKTSVDESSLTGESIPVTREINSNVYAGTLNIDGFVKIKAEKIGEDSTFGKVIQLIKSAEQSEVPSARIVDKYAAWFTPVILSIAVITYLITRDINRSITVLIVGCPCSFLLAGPVSTVAAIGRAARAGLMIKGGEFLEKIAVAKGFYFDKTGTITEGKPKVVKIIETDSIGEKEIIGIAASIEYGSLHPLARAITEKAEEMKCQVLNAENIITEIGVGVKGNVNGKLVEVCSDSDCDDDGITYIAVKIDDEIVGKIGLFDEPRKNAADTINNIKKLGINDVSIMSGDQESAVNKIACDVGISSCDYRLKPHEKMDRIRSYTGGSLVYVGDGINDAPALKAADVGIAMGLRGSDAALETADVVLMNDKLQLLPFLIKLSRKMSSTIKINIAISLTINVASIIAGSIGLLTPVLGAISHNIGSILVVMLSASILLIKE
ncbi:heavy metal translocating P-type ATPase [Spirochaetota bacterium]